MELQLSLPYVYNSVGSGSAKSHPLIIPLLQHYPYYKTDHFFITTDTTKIRCTMVQISLAMVPVNFTMLQINFVVHEQLSCLQASVDNPEGPSFRLP